MLSGLSKHHFSVAIAALEQAPYTFHLTGSRCFGYEKPTSDWDFFVGIPADGLAKLHIWLTEHGFRKESNDSYIERPANPLNESLEVWVHQGASIHIQIVRDEISKLAIQAAMKKVPGMEQMLKSLSKENRKAIWQMGRAIFEAGERSTMRVNVAA